MKLPLTLYDSLLVKYKPSSIKTFAINIKRILNDVYNLDEYQMKPLLNVKRVSDYILNDVPKLTSQLNLAAAVLTILKFEKNIPERVIDYYQKLFDNVSKQLAQEQKYPTPTEDEKNNLIKWSEVLKIAKSYKGTSPADEYKYIKYLVLSLYTLIPPLRGQDYLNAIIMKVDNPKDYPRLLSITNKNIFDLKNKKFVIGHYKTEKTHGTRIIDIPPKLIPIVEDWFKQTETQILIPNLKEKDKPMTQQAFTDLLFRIFQPKNISTSMLRKIYISYKLKSIKNNPEKRKKLAYIMGHTLETQEFIYNRFK